MRLKIGISLLLTALSLRADSVDRILASYVTALGGQAAVDHILSRVENVQSGHGAKAKVTWLAPDKVLRVTKHERQGYDGNAAWYETPRKRVQKLQRSVLEELETDANPIRYIHLKDLYRDLETGATARLGDKQMDVIVAPNSLGATKFFFDRSDHLLYRIEEFGVASAYFKHIVEFRDYKELDGIKLPVHIVRSTDEPGAEQGDLHLTRITQNGDVPSQSFQRPSVGTVISGGKH